MNGCQNFPEVYSFFHGFVMSIITQFPNHVAYRISLLQTALPAFILKQGREIYFWVDFQCKRKHNAKLVLIKRSLRYFWFYTLLSIHAQYTYTRKTITRPKPEWSVTHFDTLYHPVFTRVVKIASLHPSIGTRFDDWETVTPDKWHFAAHSIFFFFFLMTEIFHSILLFTGLDIWSCIIWGQMRIVYTCNIFYSRLLQNNRIVMYWRPPLVGCVSYIWCAIKLD